MYRIVINAHRPSAILHLSHWQKQCLCTRLSGYLQSRQLSSRNYQSLSNGFRRFSSSALREQDVLAEKKKDTKKHSGKSEGKGKKKGKGKGKPAKRESLVAPNSDAIPLADDTADRKVFVGKLPLDVDRMRLMREFSEFGKVDTAYILRDHSTGEPRGSAFVEYATAEGAIAALAHGRVKKIDGAEIVVSKPSPIMLSRRREPRSEPSCGIFVGNIGNETTADDLAMEFGAFGDIVSVRVPTYPEDGKSRGFGIVEFKNVETAQKVLEETKGRKVRGRTYLLDFSTPPRKE